MDPLIWIAIAFALGLVARQIGLPPLVGFLAAGFVLNAHGVEETEGLRTISNIGIWLLLFGIGLKLRLRSLIRPEVWAGTTIHMVCTIVVMGAAVLGLSAAGVSLFAGVDLRAALLIGFGLSFSSTVFAVKALESKGEMSLLHGRTAIGILIMQDVIAIVFLTISTGKIPSPWALTLLLLPLLRPVLLILMKRCGRDELLVLFGLLLTIGAAVGFDAVGLKPDLGALVAGMLVAHHPRSSELSKSVLSFKHLFLVGFFLTIGMSGLPTLEVMVIAVLLVLAVPLKVALFFLLLARFRLRARTSVLASFVLGNYSEFGLIVAALARQNGWLDDRWLVIMAVAMSLSFVAAAPPNYMVHRIYARLADWLARFESKRHHPDQRPIDIGDVTILIFGLGRVGAGAYDALRDRHGDTVLGVDADSETVEEHRRAGRDVALGDATDQDFWHRIRPDSVRLIVLAMPNHQENLIAIDQIHDGGYGGLIAATAQFDDEIAELKERGVHAAFDLHAEAGAGLAAHVCLALDALTGEPGDSGQ